MASGYLKQNQTLCQPDQRFGDYFFFKERKKQTTQQTTIATEQGSMVLQCVQERYLRKIYQ